MRNTKNKIEFNINMQINKKQIKDLQCREGGENYQRDFRDN